MYKDNEGRLGPNFVYSSYVDWVPEDGDAFIALLATPNGSGAGWLLADHYDEL